MNDIPLEESIEHITAIIDDFMNDNYLDLMNPKIKDIILKNIKPILCLIYNKEVSEDIDNDIYDIDDLLNMSIDTYFGMNDISREIHSNKVKSLNKEYVNKRLIELRNIPLPAQNTP